MTERKEDSLLRSVALQNAQSILSARQRAEEGLIRLNEALQKHDETQARLAAIVESSEDAIVAKTLESRIVSWNAGAERLFGYRAQEAIGKLITILIPPERVDEERFIMERLCRGERIEHYETAAVKTGAPHRYFFDDLADS